MKISLREIKNIIYEAMETYEKEVEGVSHDTMSSGIQSMEEDAIIHKVKLKVKIKNKK